VGAVSEADLAGPLDAVPGPSVADAPADPTADPTAADPTAADPTSHPIVAEPSVVDPSAAHGLDVGDASLLGLVDRLAAVLERSDLLELEVQAGSTALILRRPEALAPAAGAGSGQAAAGGAASGPGAAAGGAAPERSGDAQPEVVRASVKAPLTGIWYSAPAPGSGPFVQVGGEVAVGQVIGLIEAMKLFNEIKSDLAGRVVRVAAENGQLVKAKQPLIEVEPL
jgi:acetyl-CoA carboxylase biotin carboxyl carrier protein